MKYKVVESLKRKGFPTSSSKYKEAHDEADIKEKKKYPKGYSKLKKIDNKISKGELIGKNTKKGKIEVSRIVPRKLRDEVAYHERIENKKIRKKN